MILIESVLLCNIEAVFDVQMPRFFGDESSVEIKYSFYRKEPDLFMEYYTALCTGGLLKSVRSADCVEISR